LVSLAAPVGLAHVNDATERLLLGAPRKLRRALHADGREELDCDAAVAVRQIFDAGDLADVLLVKRITRNVKRNRDEETHAFVKTFVFGKEIDAVARDVFRGGGLLEMDITRFGRAHFKRLTDADAAAAPAFLLFNFLHRDIRTRAWS
jgi:hypothetical protein